jgi:dTDP-4-dehydrorhamnose reductase
MLGSDLVEYLRSQGEEVAEFHRGNINLDPLSNPLARRFVGFDVVVNCVAYTNVDDAEDEQTLALKTNALIPMKLAFQISSQKTRLIHISTDYVFDGNKGSPYLPSDPISPVSIYGHTKAQAEIALLDKFSRIQIIRTSWLYGANGKCFPKTIAEKLRSGQDVRVVSDQFGTPTHTLDLAQFIHRAGKEKLENNILHGVSQGSTSWFEFAQAIAAQIPGSGAVHPVPSAEYPTKAPRPLDSTLEPSELPGFSMPHWREAWEKASSRILP